MPLTPGCGRETVSENIREMRDSGRPQNQAVAAALETKRRTCRAEGKHMARKKGGRKGKRAPKHRY